MERTSAEISENTLTSDCKVELKWITPNAQENIIEIAKVSSTDPTAKNYKLLGYLIRNNHNSPFEMCSMCLEITCSRAISRQILRHRSFSFQEFSQRYQSINILPEPIFVGARSQDLKNRQNSIDDMSDEIKKEWLEKQQEIWGKTQEVYKWALEKGIAKEVARAILPEGNTPTKLYMTGTIRSFIHYLQVRCGNGTQKEHMDVANACKDIFVRELPIVAKALDWV